MTLSAPPGYTPPGYAHPDVLVSAEWLAGRLHDNSVQIVEVGMSPDSCAAHIPGAVFWHIFTDLINPDFSQKLDPAAMATLLSRSGITPETTVIAYGSEPGTGGWMFWLLTLMGHRHVRVLNGGHRYWVKHGHPVTDQFSIPNPTTYPTEALTADLQDTERRITYADLRALFQQSDRSEVAPIFLDVRTEREYSGKQYLIKPPEEDERAGHIPGAVHLDHLLTMNEDGTFKGFDELKSLLVGKGITSDSVVVPYCAIGARSAYMWFVLKYLLGYPTVRNYDGSWNEWSRVPDAPVDSSF